MPNRGRAPESPTSPRRLKVRERALQALEMRKAGATFDQIAAALHYSDRGQAHHSVMGLLRMQNEEAAESERQLQLGRCDRLLLGVWANAITGQDLDSTGMALKIVERICRLLGLDQNSELALHLNQAGMIINVITAIPRPSEIVDAQVKVLPEGKEESSGG